MEAIVADPEYLSSRDARTRVKRSRRTIQRWKRQGMRYITINGRDFIALTDLQAALRAKILAHKSTRFQHKHPTEGAS